MKLDEAKGGGLGLRRKSQGKSACKYGECDTSHDYLPVEMVKCKGMSDERAARPREAITLVPLLFPEKAWV